MADRMHQRMSQKRWFLPAHNLSVPVRTGPPKLSAHRIIVSCLRNATCPPSTSLIRKHILTQHGILHKSPPRHPHSPPHSTVHAASLPGHKNSSFPSCTPTHRPPVTMSREETNASSKPVMVQQQSLSVSHQAGRLKGRV